MSVRRLRGSFVAFSIAVAVPLAALVVPAGMTRAADRRPARDVMTFSALQTLSVEAAMGQAREWLASVNKSDPATTLAFDAIWAEAERPLLDRLADSLALGDPEASRLLLEGRLPQAPAPTVVPPWFTDGSRPTFVRANVGVAYAAALSNRRVFEEALDVLKTFKAEQVADPAAYLFHRAVAEHALLAKDDATRSILRLLDDAPEAPERYRQLAILMQIDMLGWKQKDLGEIGRKMTNIERRLDLDRAGPKTQKIQREVVARLDELIKELENQAKGSSQCNGGACPSGAQPGQGGSNTPSAPQKDSYGGNNGGPGNVDNKRLEGLARAWGKLPANERAQAMENLKRDLPAQYREAIEVYFKKMAQTSTRR